MKKINNILVILTIISAYVFLFIDGYYGIDRILLCLVLIPVVLVPKIAKKLFKINISDGLELVYIVFIILTMLLGSIMGFFSLISWYDSFTHFLSGMYTFVMGIFFLVWFKVRKIWFFPLGDGDCRVCSQLCGLFCGNLPGRHPGCAARPAGSR